MQQKLNNPALDKRATIISLILVATVTEAMLLLLPFYIGGISDSLELTQLQVGLLGSADLSGIAIATTSGMVWLRKVAWRPTVIIALVVLLVANILSLGEDGFVTLMLIRMISGLAAGVAYAVALAGLCDTAKKARNTALMVCSQVIFGAVGLLLLPLMGAEALLSSTYVYIICWTLVALLVACLAFPNNPVAHTDSGALQWQDFGSPGVLAFMGTALYFLTIGVVWGYLERIAIQAGMTLEQVGTSLSLGYIISLIGSFGAAWLGVRMGRAWPMLVSGIIQLCMLGYLANLLDFEDVMLTFFLANAIFQVFWSFIISYQIIIFNDADRSGRFIPLYGSAMHVALAIGPFVGSMMIVDNSYTLVLYFGMATLVGCYLSFLLSVYRGRTAIRKGVTV